MDRLAKLLGTDRTELEDALGAAREELEELRVRESELVAMIERAEAMLGVDDADDRLTLHEAIAVVLRDAGNRWMHVREIADTVNARALYRKRDGSVIEANQIHARTKNYVQMFEKDGPRVRLRSGRVPTVPSSRSKYDRLGDRLRAVTGDVVVLRFDDIDETVGGLPASAYRHQAWWANERTGSHVQARSWMDAGWRVDGFNVDEGWVRFRREDGEGG